MQICNKHFTAFSALQLDSVGHKPGRRRWRTIPGASKVNRMDDFSLESTIQPNGGPYAKKRTEAEYLFGWVDAYLH